MTVEFLQIAHGLKLDFSPRDGIQQVRYAMKILRQDPTHPVAKDKAWHDALVRCLGEDALDLNAMAERQKRTLGGDAVPLGFGDFFFSPDDPLNPDALLGDDEDEMVDEDEDDEEGDELWHEEED